MNDHQKFSQEKIESPIVIKIFLTLQNLTELVSYLVFVDQCDRIYNTEVTSHLTPKTKICLTEIGIESDEM